MASARPQKTPLRLFQSSGRKEHLTTNSHELARTRNYAQTPKETEVMRKNYIGSSLDDLFEEYETFEEAQALAIKDVVVWQLTDAIEKQSPNKARLALRLKTSRPQADRLLGPACNAPDA